MQFDHNDIARRTLEGSTEAWRKTSPTLPTAAVKRISSAGYLRPYHIVGGHGGPINTSHVYRHPSTVPSQAFDLSRFLANLEYRPGTRSLISGILAVFVPTILTHEHGINDSGSVLLIVSLLKPASLSLRHCYPYPSSSFCAERHPSPTPPTSILHVQKHLWLCILEARLIS